MSVHTILPDDLTAAAAEVLAAAGIAHVAHGIDDPVGAAEIAVADPDALALIGPFRSGDVAEAVEVTAPAGLPLLAPVATWSGVTRLDEPVGDDHPQPHHGTVFRLVARDTEVARRIVAAFPRAQVVAGEYSYGQQLDEQLTLAGLERSEDAEVVVLAGLAGEPEIARARATAPKPLIAFDGVQGADLGERDVFMAMPFAPGQDLVERARHAATIIAEAGARDRAALLAKLRAQFDEHGDPLDPPVWLWRADRDWNLRPDRPL